MFDPAEFFQNPVQSGSGSELQNPGVSRSGNRIKFNIGRLQSRDEQRSALDLTESGLKPILAGSGLDGTAIF